MIAIGIVGPRDPIQKVLKRAYLLGKVAAKFKYKLVTGGANGVDFEASCGFIAGKGNPTDLLWYLGRWDKQPLCPQRNLNWAAKHTISLVCVATNKEVGLKGQYLERNSYIARAVEQLWVPMEDTDLHDSGTLDTIIKARTLDKEVRFITNIRDVL